MAKYKYKQVPTGVRRKIWKRDKYKCTYCTKDLKKERGPHITVDHIVPRARGGNDDASNLTTACTECNTDKRDLSLMEFLMGFNIKINPALVKIIPDEFTKRKLIKILIHNIVQIVRLFCYKLR